MDVLVVVGRHTCKDGIGQQQQQQNDSSSIIIAIDPSPCCCECSRLHAGSKDADDKEYPWADFTIRCGGAWVSTKELAPHHQHQQVDDVNADELFAFVSKYCESMQAPSRVVKGKCGICVEVLDDPSKKDDDVISRVHRDLQRLVSERFRHLRASVVVAVDKISSIARVHIKYPRSTGHQILEHIIRSFVCPKFGASFRSVRLSHEASKSDIVKHWGWSIYIDASRMIPIIVESE